MGEIEIYQSPDKQVSIEVAFEGNSVWLSLNQIAALFGRDKSVISRGLTSISREKELSKRATVAKNATIQREDSLTTARDGERYYKSDLY